MSNVSILSFNNGEVSPFIDPRSDVEKYSSSCRIMENMLPMVYGGARRRPGTEFIHAAKSDDTVVRLIPFKYSSSISYICEFGHEYIRFYYDGAILEDGGNPVEVVTTYQSTDLFELQYKQIGDTMWITHPSYAPRKLIRTSATTFSIEAIEFTNGPFLPRNDLENNDGITMTSSVTALAGTGTLTASGATFETTHVGAYFKLVHVRGVNTITLKKTNTQTGESGSIPIKGGFYFRTHGSWTATLEIKRNDNGAGWEVFRTYTGEGDTNISEAFTEDDDGIEYLLNVKTHVSGTVTLDLNCYETTTSGIVQITDFTSSTVVSSEVIDALDSTNGTDATLRWSEGAWSLVQGYPTGIGFFEDRCIYAGSPENAQSVWASEIGDYENFGEGVNDDDSFSLTLTTTNDICWIDSLEAIVVGTQGGVWALSSSKLYTPITPTNFAAREQVTIGCCPIQPIRIDKSILYIDYTYRKIRELTYLYSEDRYVAPDLTEFADHITESGINSYAVQRSPYTIVWCVRNDGVLISMLYDRDQNVVSWSRHPTRTGDYIESVAVIPGDEEDEVWLSTKRSINDADVRYIERMKPFDFGDQEDAYFVDCGLTYDGAATTTVTGLDHLEGETVNIYGDGAVYDDDVVESGEVVLDTACALIHVGLPYRYTLKSMRLDINSESGSSFGSKKKISEVAISFYNTFDANYGKDVDNLYDINWRSEEDMSAPPVMFTGNKYVVADGGFDTEDSLVISGNSPAPCIIRAIIVRMEVTGR